MTTKPQYSLNTKLAASLNMGEEAKGAGKDVIKQTQKSSNELYKYVDLNGGGNLVEAFRRAQATKDFTEVEQLIEGFREKFLYNRGAGKDIDIGELVQWRKQSRVDEEPSKRDNAFVSFFTKCTSRVENTIEAVGIDNYALSENTASTTRPVYWDINQRAAVGENILHLCFLNATEVHYEIGRLIIKKYPQLVNDIYLSDEFYGESTLHMAIVNENQAMVHFLCKHGADIHERAYGAFFCPEDQRKSRKDHPSKVEIILSEETNYESNTYWGEYPLSFAASLGLEDMVRYLLARGACPNKKDTNGNTVLHMMVIHDKMDMYDLILDYGCHCGQCDRKPLTDIENNLKLTPLTLAAKLARREMFDHILTREREVFWQYGEVTCAAFSLKELDTLSCDGHINANCALNIITHEESVPHLALFDGILNNLLKEKWNHACRYRFYQLLALYILFLIAFSIAILLRPLEDLGCWDGTKDNASLSFTLDNSTGIFTLVNGTACDHCFLLNTIKNDTAQQVRAAFEILTLLFAFLYIVILIREVIFQEGLKTVFFDLIQRYKWESTLHMAIVNENQAMVHFLCKHGADIHERAYGAFFCPEDQRKSRKDHPSIGEIILSEETNYESNTYWGEYPLSFAASLGLEDMVRYLLARGACPNKKDTNGNTVLHMMVIHDKMDMYDLILDYGCYCGQCDRKPLTDIENNLKLTPLTLAAKLARREMFDHILTRDREVFWQYGEVTCAAFSLKELDTLSCDGHINANCALNIITHEESVPHLALFDGILNNLLKEKWNHACRYRFYQLLALYILFLIAFSIAILLRPLEDLDCFNGTKDNVSLSFTLDNSTGTWTLVNNTPCDHCFLLNTIKNDTAQQVRAAFEILTLLFAFLYILILIREVIFQEGLKTVFFDLVHNPLRLLLTLSCVLLLTCLAARFTCSDHLEDHLAIAALIMAWPYSLTFCRGFALVGPFVVMIYQMLKKDFLIFFVIYMIFVIGFSQAMFLVMMGYDDRTVQENLFTRWFSAGLGLIILSLGEYEDLYGQVANSNSPFKILGLIMFFLFLILGALLIVNMLIAMMGNTYLLVAETKKEWTRQWARIVLATERMLTPEQRLAAQKKYSQSLGTNGERALIMRLRNHENQQQSQVSNDPKQQAKAKTKNSVPLPRKDYDWLDTSM
ncbi:uncharacterized protein LOC144642181 [Oculina patagonica]